MSATPEAIATTAVFVGIVRLQRLHLVDQLFGPLALFEGLLDRVILPRADPADQQLPRQLPRLEVGQKQPV